MEDAKTLQAVEVPLPGGPCTIEFTWEEFSLRKALRNIERAFVEKALEDCDGKVTAAARLLGFDHHQSLCSLINTQHSDLLSKRKPIRPRRKPLITKDSKHKSVRKRMAKGAL